MTFTLWSIGHFVYLVSPFVLFSIICFLIKNRSDKTKYIVGVILGAISILILIVRNIDIFARNGWDHEIIPLQVCHIGNIVSSLALISKKKSLIITTFCFNLIPAFLAMVFADSLANYDTLLNIRPQTYIWGHIFIVICALYGIVVFKPNCNRKDLVTSLIIISCIAVVAVICNSVFRATLGWEPNYFYLFDYSGTPLKFLYNVLPTTTWGWFTINWFYTISLFAFFVCVFIGLFFLVQLYVKKTTK